MNSWELFEAMTDLEDDTILSAAQSVPRRRLGVMSLLRPLAAACLMLVLVFSVLSVNEANAGTNQIRWTRRIRDDYFYYLFWNAERPETPMPTYRTTWFPEGYVTWLENESEHDYQKRTHLAEDDSIGISFSYRYVGSNDRSQYSYKKGSYTYTETTVNTLPADLYHVHEYNMGILIWFDREESLMFSLTYECDDETAMRIAEGVALMEGE